MGWTSLECRKVVLKMVMKSQMFQWAYKIIKGCRVCEAPSKKLGLFSVETQETFIKVLKSSFSKKNLEIFLKILKI